MNIRSINLRAHSQGYKPEPAKPIRFSTHRRSAPLRWAVALAVVGALVLGTTALIGRLHATDAQLQAAHLQGMATGMTMCRGGGE